MILFSPFICCPWASVKPACSHSKHSLCYYKWLWIQWPAKCPKCKCNIHLDLCLKVCPVGSLNLRELAGKSLKSPDMWCLRWCGNSTGRPHHCTTPRADVGPAQLVRRVGGSIPPGNTWAKIKLACSAGIIVRLGWKHPPNSTRLNNTICMKPT